MIAITLMTVPLIIMLCVIAYRLATYALPFMLALEAARFAYGTGAGWIGAGIVGCFAGVVSFGILAFLFAKLRTPILRLAVALIFAVPATMAGYALVQGVAGELVPSQIWQRIFSVIGALAVGCSAFARLAAFGQAGSEQGHEEYLRKP